MFCISRVPKHRVFFLHSIVALSCLLAFCVRFSGVHTRNISELMFTHRIVRREFLSLPFDINCFRSCCCCFSSTLTHSLIPVCVCVFVQIFRICSYICSLCSAGDISDLRFELSSFFPTAFFFAFVLLLDSFFRLLIYYVPKKNCYR